MYLGVDIGSTTSKAAIIDTSGRLVGSTVVDMGTGTSGAEQSVALLFEKTGLTYADIGYTVATGYGRKNFTKADMQITEISCHAFGVHHFFPKARTVIDIGGQDAKVIRLDARGHLQNFGMNEKCAAGTGRFLEVMARVLGCKLSELSDLAERSKQPAQISSVCTVFAESEVISQLSAGTKAEDVAKGAHMSVATRVAGMCSRTGIESQVVMTGGVAINKDMVASLSEVLAVPISVPESPQIMGAVGAAYHALKKAAK